MGIVKGRVTSGFPCSNSVGPKNMWCYIQLLSDVAITSLDYGIPYGPMGTFDYAASS